MNFYEFVPFMKSGSNFRTPSQVNLFSCAPRWCPLSCRTADRQLWELNFVWERPHQELAWQSCHPSLANHQMMGCTHHTYSGHLELCVHDDTQLGERGEWREKSERGRKGEERVRKVMKGGWGERGREGGGEREGKGKEREKERWGRELCQLPLPDTTRNVQKQIRYPSLYTNR